MLLKHKKSGKERKITNDSMLEHYLSNGWESAEGPAKKDKKSKKADPVVEEVQSEVGEETKPITESKENEDGNNQRT